MLRIISLTLLFAVAFSSPAPYLPHYDQAKAELKKAGAQQLDPFTCQFIPEFLQVALGCTQNGEGNWLMLIRLYLKHL